MVQKNLPGSCTKHFIHRIMGCGICQFLCLKHSVNKNVLKENSVRKSKRVHMNPSITVYVTLLYSDLPTYGKYMTITNIIISKIEQYGLSVSVCDLSQCSNYSASAGEGRGSLTSAW